MFLVDQTRQLQPFDAQIVDRHLVLTGLQRHGIEVARLLGRRRRIALADVAEIEASRLTASMTMGFLLAAVSAGVLYVV